ncbi:G-type lectin S-receptor-like serine/threonine-protein kinase SD1-1 [Camellia lanceoleosa]|uniref:G-type lectin S-receptor-like serine/threonine-protein kinase SD1-1 n=1 Tax=Camellia lanceoleosa TaxID=1840588 RepID=A0ACC0GRB7_9ERIC|nr:G-type lectin S-receptor-like serine/threonine-protein kinase SD1-1 [Camellia lanceoleosa]
MAPKAAAEEKPAEKKLAEEKKSTVAEKAQRRKAEELLDDPSEVGDETTFALSSLISEKEDLQKLAFQANVVDKLCNHLQNGSLQAKRIQGILLALADLCSQLESCRRKLECLKNCSCTAYANSDVAGGGSGCLLWYGDLIDIRSFPNPVSRSDSKEKEKRPVLVIIPVSVALLLFLLASCIIWKRIKQTRGKSEVP